MPDEGREGATPDEDPDEEATPESLMSRAERAIDSYDFPRARAALERAAAASDGAPGPAAALLALLVETLGDDAGALASEAWLSPAALATPKVRGLLALAAARSGDEERALGLVRGAGDGHAAAVFAALAAAAIGRGDADAAAGHLEQTRRRDPAHPAIAGLGGELARVRAAARGPAEAEVLALASAGRDDEAEKKADFVLARWPESEAARRTLRAIEERRRHAEVQRLAAEGEAAFEAGDTAAALAWLGQAAAAARGPEREAIEHRAREIEATARARREAEAVERTSALLGAPDAKEGLAAYLELDEALRRRVRARATGGAVERLEAARGAPRARVEAVLALGEALTLAAADPEAALALLGPHLAALERVPEARQIARQAEARRAARRATRAREDVRAARAAFTAGDAAEATRRLHDAILRDLPAGERAEAAALRAEAARVVEKERRAAEVGRLRAAGQMFEARALAEELAAGAAGEERARWEAERRAIQAEIQAAFRVEVDDEPRPFDPRSDPSGRTTFGAPMRWLTADGATLVLAEGYDRWVQVSVIDHARMTVRAVVALRTPDAVGNVMVEVIGETAWLVGERGGLLALRIETWDVVLFRSAQELNPRHGTVNAFALPAGEGSPSPRYFWAFPCNENNFVQDTRVIDLEHRRAVRELPDVMRLVSLAGARAPRVCCLRLDELLLCEERGAPLRREVLSPAGATPMSVALHPDGHGLVVLIQTQRGLAWVEVPFEGPAREPRHIAGSDGTIEATIACVLDAGFVAVLFDKEGGTSELLALRAGPGGLEPLYRQPVADTAFLAQDAGARRLVLYDSTAAHVVVADIGPAPLELPVPPPDPTRWIGDLIELGDCLRPLPRREAEARAIKDELLGMPQDVVTRWTDRYLRRHGGDPGRMAEAVLALEAVSLAGESSAMRLRLKLQETHPDHPEVRLLRADHLARAGRWREAADLLSGLPGAAFGDDHAHARHCHHLLALAALHHRDFERARAMHDGALAHAGPCDLGALGDLLTPISAGSPGAPALAQLVAILRAADACLARDDGRGALTALADGRLRVHEEVQIAARRADAFLRVEPVTRRERFEKIMALARLVERHGEKRPSRREELAIPGATWDEARLDAVTERARAWLLGFPLDSTP